MTPTFLQRKHAEFDVWLVCLVDLIPPPPQKNSKNFYFRKSSYICQVFLGQKETCLDTMPYSSTGSGKGLFILIFFMIFFFYTYNI